MANQNTSKTLSNRNRKTAGLVILAFFILAFLLFCLQSCMVNKGSAPESALGLILDESAVEGGWDEINTDEIVANLNKKVEAGMINIAMNTSPVFADGTSEGNLMIVNETINNYPQVVEITRNDTGELIYKSGGIPVGSKIEKAKLDVDLPAGTYACTAMFHNMNPDTGESLGCAGAIITVTVQR